MDQQEFSRGPGRAVAIFREIMPKGKGYVLAQSAGPAAGPAVEAAVEALLAAGARDVYLRPLPADNGGTSYRTGRFRFAYESSMLWMEAPLHILPPDPRIAFELLGPDNGEAYLSLYNACFYEVPNSATYGAEDLTRLLSEPRPSAAIVRADTERAGILELLTGAEPPSIEGIGLLARMRGRGLGRALLRSAMGLLAGQGFSRASLIVSSNNIPAHRLYVSEGFVCQRIVSRWFRLTPRRARQI